MLEIINERLLNGNKKCQSVRKFLIFFMYKLGNKDFMLVEKMQFDGEDVFVIIYGVFSCSFFQYKFFLVRELCFRFFYGKFIKKKL